MNFKFFVSFDGNKNKKIIFFHNNKKYEFKENNYDISEEVSQDTLEFELKTLYDAIELASSFIGKDKIKELVQKYLNISENQLLDALYNYNLKQKDSLFDKYVKTRKFIETNYGFYDDIVDDLLYFLLKD